MSPRTRVALMALVGACLAPAVWSIAAALPPFGAPTGAYGPTVNALGPPLRHVSNMVSAVNFDFRGVDTLGEEFMLLGAVTGAVLLLRGARGEDLADAAGRVAGRRVEPRSSAVVLVCHLLGPAILVLGLYMALHATVTPGGGFQGGVVIASGFLLVYLGEGYRPWRALVRSRALAVAEGGGALVFALAGFWPMLCGQPYLANVLPLGVFRDMLSGGLMLVENAGVALAVTGGFAILFLEFLEETRAPRPRDEPGSGGGA
ncbi:MAG TPA: MnhB domain-containing protein [Caulobacteraceae bacterium]|nr:MnhB domain-containing protein [Caulobacteraceae bacterium]